MNIAKLAFLFSLSGAVYCHSQPRDGLPMAYMRELYSALYSGDSTKVPDTIDPSAPTDIWCFSDKGTQMHVATLQIRFCFYFFYLTLDNISLTSRCC